MIILPSNDGRTNGKPRFLSFLLLIHHEVWKILKPILTPSPLSIPSPHPNANPSSLTLTLKSPPSNQTPPFQSCPTACSSHACMGAKLLQLCQTLWDPKDCSLPGCSVQARILEWVAMPSSWDLPNPGIESASPATPA